MNAQQALAEALGFDVNFERFNACISPRDSVFEPAVMQFVTLAAEREYGLSAVAHEDRNLGDAMQHLQEHPGDDSAVRWGEVHLGIAANFHARAAGAVEAAKALVPKLRELGVLVERQS